MAMLLNSKDESGGLLQELVLGPDLSITIGDPEVGIFGSLLKGTGDSKAEGVTNTSRMEKSHIWAGGKKSGICKVVVYFWGT